MNIIELFGGIGAPRRALENIGLEVNSLDYVDIDKNVVTGYNALFNECYEPNDVINFNKKYDDVDLLFHGSPCQDFSINGLMDLSRGRSILFKETIRIVKDIMPKFVIWENVKSLLSYKFKCLFQHYIDELDFGYKSYYSILDAKDYGVNQSRPRLFCVSIRRDMNQCLDFDKLEKKDYPNFSDFTCYSKEFDLVPTLTNFSRNRLLNDEISVCLNTISTIQCHQGFSYGSAELIFRDERIYDFSNKYTHRLYKLSEVKKILPLIFENNIDLNDIFRRVNCIEALTFQGFKRKDYEILRSVGISNSNIYKLAGNSICVKVLESLFKELFINKYSEKEICLFDI